MIPGRGPLFTRNQVEHRHQQQPFWTKAVLHSPDNSSGATVYGTKALVAGVDEEDLSGTNTKPFEVLAKATSDMDHV